MSWLFAIFKAFYGISTYCVGARATPFSGFASIAVGGIHFLSENPNPLPKLTALCALLYPVLFIGITALSV